MEYFPYHEILSQLGCSLYLKNDLNFMGIKSSPSFIVRRRMVVELMVIVIGKRSPRWKVLGVKLCFEYFLFGFHLNSTSLSLHFPNLPLRTKLCHIYRRYLHQNMWGNTHFGGKNFKFCIYPLSDCCWEVFQ